MATVKKALKAVDSSKKPGLAKLPTAVRNKMGYAQNGMPMRRGMAGMKGLKNLSSKSMSDSLVNNRPPLRSLGSNAESRMEAVNSKKPMKAGGMLKRADGSTSQRGLWDNIRSAAKKNKAAGKPGKKPTSAMLKQEKKIKSQTKKK